MIGPNEFNDPILFTKLEVRIVVTAFSVGDDEYRHSILYALNLLGAHSTFREHQRLWLLQFLEFLVIKYPEKIIPYKGFHSFIRHLCDINSKVAYAVLDRVDLRKTFDIRFDPDEILKNSQTAYYLGTYRQFVDENLVSASMYYGMAWRAGYYKAALRLCELEMQSDLNQAYEWLNKAIDSLPPDDPYLKIVIDRFLALMQNRDFMKMRQVRFEIQCKLEPRRIMLLTECELSAAPPTYTPALSGLSSSSSSSSHEEQEMSLSLDLHRLCLG